MTKHQMSDPHVKYLDYWILHGPGIDWSKSDAANFEEDRFTVEVKDRRVRFRFRTHYSSPAEARAAVEAVFIPNWEFNARLLRGPDAFTLDFRKAEMIDRNSRHCADSAYMRVSAGTSWVTVKPVPQCPPAYPGPPERGLCRTPDVESMCQRYLGHLDGREPLPAMAYFCLTVLQEMAGDRKQAVKRFGISKKVLDFVGELSSERGGRDARKRKGGDTPYSDEEERFLKTAVRTMILRAAEVECDPGAAQELIAMDDIREQAG